MNNSKNITMQYSLVQAAFWMGFASISAFSSVYLLSIGISNSLIGLTLSIGALASALSQPLLGILIDNDNPVTTKQVLIICAGLIVILALLLFPVSKGVPLIIPLLYGMIIWMLQLAQPFANALGMVGVNAGYKLHFGPARAIGSLGYALIAFILGKITDSKGGGIVPYFIAACFFISAISLFIFPVKEAEIPKKQDSSNSANKSGISTFFKKYGTFGIMIIGLVLIFFSHVVLNSFGLQIVTPRGGTSDAMGTSTAISASVELVPMFIFPFLMKKFKMSSLLKLSAVFFTLKTLFTLLSTNIPAYYATQLCQMVGWGIMAVGIVYYVNDFVDEHDKAQGQAYAGMALTMGNVIGNMAGGAVIDHYGINTLLLIGVISAAIGTIIFWVGISKSDKILKSRNSQE